MIPFGSMVEYHPFLRRTSQDSINLVRKCHLDETRQNPRRKLHAKEMIMPKKGGNFLFPIADGTVKLSGGDNGMRKSTSTRNQPERGEKLRDDLRGEPDGSQQIDVMMDDREARSDSWSIEGKYIHRHHVEPGVQLTVPRKNHSQYHCDTLT